MAVAKKPGSSTTAPAGSEVAADRFISGAERKPPRSVDDNMVPVMIRMEQELRDRIDRASKAVGLGRSAWLRLKAIKALDDEGKY